MDKLRVVCAGMYRSGSVYQFNAVRVLLEHVYGEENVYSCFHDGYEVNNKPVEVIKIHRVNEAVLRSADYVVSTLRDPNDIAKSFKRRAEHLKDNPNPGLKALSNPENLSKYFTQAYWWLSKSDYIQHFDKIDNAPMDIIMDYAKLFNIKRVRYKEVLDKLNSQLVVPAEGIDSKTLLHANHITREK